MNALSFHIETLGCKLNFAESAHISHKFSEAGYIESEGISDANIIVIHSCAVTSGAEKKTRQLLHKIKRLNPNAKIAILGCYPSVDENFANSVEADYVLDNENKMKIVDVVTSDIKSNCSNEFHTAYSLNTRTRSFLKIQDGCDYFCSYCTVAFARKRSRSNTIDGVINDMKIIAENGFKEIIFTGVNIGTFGQKNGETFYDLLKTAENAFPDIRIRMGSVEPDLLTDEIIELVAKSKSLMPHFHIPLQSGSDNVLQQMRRRYDTKLFSHKCNLIKELIPNACIAADVIAGYPSESEDEFNESYKLIENLPLSYLHVFGYSDRPLAAASKSTIKNSAQTIKKRVDSLIDLGNTKRRIFFEQNLGSAYPVLFETKLNKNKISGFTNNYIKCEIDTEKVIPNSVRSAVLKKISPDNESVEIDLV